MYKVCYCIFFILIIYLIISNSYCNTCNCRLNKKYLSNINNKEKYDNNKLLEDIFDNNIEPFNNLDYIYNYEDFSNDNYSKNRSGTSTGKQNNKKSKPSLNPNDIMEIELNKNKPSTSIGKVQLEIAQKLATQKPTTTKPK